MVDKKIRERNPGLFQSRVGTAVKVGEALAKESPVEADIVIGVPDSGLGAAQGYARASGVPYGMGIIKNKYIGRTFIAPTQKERENMVFWIKVRIKNPDGVIKPGMPADVTVL